MQTSRFTSAEVAKAVLAAEADGSNVTHVHICGTDEARYPIVVSDAFNGPIYKFLTWHEPRTTKPGEIARILASAGKRCAVTAGPEEWPGVLNIYA